MRKISFQCEEESVDMFVKILHKLQGVESNRKIRVGGDEHCFYGDIDSVSDVAIDDRPYSNLSPSEQRSFMIVRTNAIPNASVFTRTPTTAPSVSQDDSRDNDNEDDTPVSALDSDAIGTIRSVISDKIEQEGTFTAFDITMELRKRGMQVYHRDVKEMVHNMYDNGDMEDYARTLLDVGSGTKALLYHPGDFDAQLARP